MSSLNWGDLIKDAAETTSYEPIPDGDYEFTILEATAKMSQSGKTMFTIKAEVSGGPHNRRLVWDNLVVSQENPTAMGIFFKKMHALGLTREYFSTSPTNAAIESVLVGRKFRGQVGSRTWQGNKKNEIKNYYPSAAVTAASAPATAAPAPAPAPAPVAAPVATQAPAAPF